MASGRWEDRFFAAVCDAGDAGGKCVGERANLHVLWAELCIVEFLVTFAVSWRGGNMGACLHRSIYCHDASNTSGHDLSVLSTVVPIFVFGAGSEARVGSLRPAPDRS